MIKEDKGRLWEVLQSLASPVLEGIEVHIRSEFEGNGVASETWELVWEVRDPKTGLWFCNPREEGSPSIAAHGACPIEIFPDPPTVGSTFWVLFQLPKGMSTQHYYEEIPYILEIERHGDTIQKYTFDMFPVTAGVGVSLAVGPIYITDEDGIVAINAPGINNLFPNHIRAYVVPIYSGLGKGMVHRNTWVIKAKAGDTLYLSAYGPGGSVVTQVTVQGK